MQMKREQARWCQCKLALFPTTLKERQTKPTTLYPLFVTQPWDDVRVTKPWDDMRPPSISSVRRSVASLWWYRPWNRHPSTTNQVTSHQMGGKVYRRINSWRIDSNMDWVSTGPCRTTYHLVICIREPVQKPLWRCNNGYPERTNGSTWAKNVESPLKCHVEMNWEYDWYSQDMYVSMSNSNVGRRRIDDGKSSRSGWAKK